MEAELTLPPAWPSHLPPPPPPPGDPPWRHASSGPSPLPAVKASLAPLPPRLGPIWLHSTAPSFEAVLGAMQEQLHGELRATIRQQLRGELSQSVREELRAELRATVRAELLEAGGAPPAPKAPARPSAGPSAPSRKSWWGRQTLSNERGSLLGTGRRRSRAPSRV